MKQEIKYWTIDDVNLPTYLKTLIDAGNKIDQVVNIAWDTTNGMHQNPQYNLITGAIIIYSKIS